MPIERSAGGGGGGGGFVKLFDSTLGATAASIDTGANAIASGHCHLYVTFELQSNETGPLAGANITFNGDAGANYDRQIGQANSTTLQASASAAATFMQLALVSCTAGALGADVHVYGTTNLSVFSYDTTNRYKQCSAANGAGWGALGNTSNYIANFSGGLWRSTAAVNQITVTCSTGGKVFAAGSRMTVWGLA